MCSLHTWWIKYKNQRFFLFCSGTFINTLPWRKGQQRSSRCRFHNSVMTVNNLHQLFWSETIKSSLLFIKRRWQNISKIITGTITFPDIWSTKNSINTRLEIHIVYSWCFHILVLRPTAALLSSSTLSDGLEGLLFLLSSSSSTPPSSFSSCSSSSVGILTVTSSLVASVGLLEQPSSLMEEEEEGPGMAEGVGTALKVMKPMRMTTRETR